MTAGWATSPAYEGTLRAIDKARELGVCVLQTRNHGHIGAAGIYSRLPLEHDLVAFVTSGAELDLRPGQPVYTPAIGSPLSFSAPAGEAAPLVVDFAPVYDLRSSPRWAELAEWIPGTIFRCIGLGTVAQVWGGLLAGLPAAGGPARPRRYRGARQSALVVMFRIDLFLEPAQFRAQMDLLARQLKELAPLDGFASASYAGDIERQREREFRRARHPAGSGAPAGTGGHRPGTGNRRALEPCRAAGREAHRSRDRRLSPRAPRLLGVRRTDGDVVGPDGALDAVVEGRGELIRAGLE